MSKVTVLLDRRNNSASRLISRAKMWLTSGGEVYVGSVMFRKSSFKTGLGESEM